MRHFLLVALLLLAAPCWAQKPDARRAAELDQMLAALKAAPNEQAAGALEIRIREAWLRAASPTTALLLARGARELGANAGDDALDDLDAALVLDPELPEAYLRRALARFQLGDYTGAVRDIQAVLQREPRHFAALQTLSRIAEAQNDFRGALAAWQKVLELSPKTPNGAERLATLKRKALGEET